MIALMLAAAIVLFSADRLMPVEQFRLDRTPPPPPENIAVLTPAHVEGASTSGSKLIALLHG